MNLTIRGMLQIAAEMENKRTVAATLKIIDSVEQKTYRSGKISMKAINDKIIPFMMSFIMEDFHPFYDEFHLNVHRLIESGLSQFNQKFRNPLFDEEVPPLVLSLDDLGIGFAVCLIPVTLSFVTFIAEVAASKIQVITASILNALTAMYLVTALLGKRIYGI